MNPTARLFLVGLSLLSARLVSGAEPIAEIVFDAGSVERQHSVVTFPVSPAQQSARWIEIEPGGARLPLQLDGAGNASVSVPALAKGAQLKGKLFAGKLPESTPRILTARAGKLLKITDDTRPVLDYQMEPGEVPAGVPEEFMHGAHLHPVFSPSGRVVTGNHPPDHRWHRGIWLAWTKTEFDGRHPDFWNMAKGEDRKLTGETRFERLHQDWGGPVHAGFVASHQFIDHTGDGETPVLHETWRLTAYHVPAKTARVFDLVSEQSCAKNLPLKLPKYYYGGLGYRGNGLWDPPENVAMLTSNGHDRKSGDATKAKWLWIGGEVEGEIAGLLILIHPENFRFPQPLRLNPKNPQICIVPSADGDWEIKPGETYTSRYRFVVLDGKPTQAEAERFWQDYANPVKVTLQ